MQEENDAPPRNGYHIPILSLALCCSDRGSTEGENVSEIKSLTPSHKQEQLEEIVFISSDVPNRIKNCNQPKMLHSGEAHSVCPVPFPLLFIQVK